MKLTKKEGSNYTMTVIELPGKREIPGLDNLVSVNVFGNDCLIGKESPKTPLYLFIPAGTQLSTTFMSYNNLYTDSALNKDTTKKGYIKDNCHVRSLKLKGVISTGLVMPIFSLACFTNVDVVEFKKGDEFDTIDGEVVCNKYETQAQKIANTRESNKPKDKLAARFDRLVPNQFRLHGDTAHLAKNLHLFSIDDVIVITNKLHGCCANFANVLVHKELPFIHRMAKRLGLPIIDKEYGNIYASRTVIKNRYINKTVTKGFYEEDIWGIVNKEIAHSLEEGITLMGEIVGYTSGNRAIQKGYDYGCGTGEHKFFVYRITYTKPSGEVIEFSFDMIREYCRMYGLLHVPLFFHGTVREFLTTFNIDRVRDNWSQEWYDKLSQSYNMEKLCELCFNKVPAEGLVVRRDGKSSYYTFKLKAKSFILKENDLLDKGEVGIE